MSKIGPRFKYLEQPIFCLCTLNDYILVASGGGGKKFGVRNKLLSFKIQNDKFSDEPIHSVEFEKEIPVFISGIESLNLFCTCLDNLTVFYNLEPNGIFNEITRITTMDYYDADIYQSVCRLDSKGNYLATGTTDGVLKLFNLNGNSMKTTLNPVLFKEAQAHSKSINDIAFLDERNMIVTAGADGTCKIFELSSLKLLKKISFRQNLNEKMNYPMRGLKYDSNSGFLYTIQAQMRGKTFLTKWNVKNNFEPVNSLQVSDTICTSLDYNKNNNLIALADCKGSLIYVDASGELSKIKEVSVGEFTIKSVAFKNNNLISGTADNALQMHYIYKRNLISFSGLFKLIILLVFIYYMTLKISK